MNLSYKINVDGDYLLILDYDGIEIYGSGSTLAEALEDLADQAYQGGL